MLCLWGDHLAGMGKMVFPSRVTVWRRGSVPCWCCWWMMVKRESGVMLGELVMVRDWSDCGR